RSLKTLWTRLSSWPGTPAEAGCGGRPRGGCGAQGAAVGSRWFGSTLRRLTAALRRMASVDLDTFSAACMLFRCGATLAPHGFRVNTGRSPRSADASPRRWCKHARHPALAQDPEPGVLEHVACTSHNGRHLARRPD